MKYFMLWRGDSQAMSFDADNYEEAIEFIANWSGNEIDEIEERVREETLEVWEG